MFYGKNFKNHIITPYLTVLVLLIPAILSLPVPALAVQVHGPPEGLYVHMMAHVFFSAALVFLLIILRLRPPGSGRGWRFFKLSIILFLLWNLDTFVVHYLSLHIPEEALDTALDIRHHHIHPPITHEMMLFYIGKFDHLLCVPAMFCLAASLRAFYQEAVKRLAVSGS